MRKLRLVALVSAASVASAAAGCIVVNRESPAPTQVVAREPGPPPHAPAHGYRRKHPQDDVDLVFDSGVGVYVVVDTPDCWWSDGGYYRWHDGVWSTGVHISGPWAVIKIDAVPSGLRAYKGEKNGKGRGNGNAPASWKR